MFNKKTAAIIACALSLNVNAQWKNNPSENIKMTSNVKNPINIEVVQDNRGGAFVFWEDKLSKFQSEVFFYHLNNNGYPSFRADGQKVTRYTNENKVSPVADLVTNNKAIVIWKDYKYNKSHGNLFGQLVDNSGRILWDSSGKQISYNKGEILNYDVNADEKGNIFVSFIEKVDNKFNVFAQNLNFTGDPKIKGDGLLVQDNTNSKSNSVVIPDMTGGAYILWQETVQGKAQLLVQHINSSNTFDWGRVPVVLSAAGKNIFSFSAGVLKNNNLYVAWQLQQSDKDIYHQVVSNSGRISWDIGGSLAVKMNGNQINPQVLTTDSAIFLSWINEIGKDRNAAVQKFNYRGEAQFKSEVVLNIEGEQLGQKVLDDEAGGAILIWIDKRLKYSNIYSQRINNQGRLIWAEEGVPVAINKDSEKSYINAISDNTGGVIAIFKDQRGQNNDLYAQKIINSGEYISKISNVTVEAVNDSLKISWSTEKEANNTTFFVERSYKEGSSEWTSINQIKGNGKGNNNNYFIMDQPLTQGNVFYRVILKDEKGNISPSSVIETNYFASTSEITVAQNVPNPFKTSTNIKFFLPKAANVQIEFFDSKLQEISQISDYYSAGENEVTFKANDLTPGIYYYKFKSGTFTEVKKMVVAD